MKQLQFNSENSETEKLIQENYGLIVSRACSFKPKGRAELEDYIQVSVLAFIKGHEKFDKNKAKFSTYISSCINNALYDYIAKNKKHSFVELKERNEEIPSEQFWELIPDNLSPIEKSVIMLKLENYTKSEIALILECTQSEVTEAFKKAKKKIKEANK